MPGTMSKQDARREAAQKSKVFCQVVLGELDLRGISVNRVAEDMATPAARLRALLHGTPAHVPMDVMIWLADYLDCELVFELQPREQKKGSNG